MQFKTILKKFDLKGYCEIENFISDLTTIQIEEFNKKLENLVK